MAFNAPLNYKGRPLVRCNNEIYYGNPTDPYVVFFQILTTTKEDDVTMADRVHVTLLKTDSSLSIAERVVKQSDKTGMFSALEIGNIWLERALSDAKKS